MYKLKVGAGKACIDPTPEMFPFPSPGKSDWGLKPLSTNGIYSCMYCRALAIESGSDKMLFVVMETSGIPPIEDLREQIAAATAFPKENIVLAATHNHTGYSVDRNLLARYEKTDRFNAWYSSMIKILTDGTVNASKEAVSTMRRAKYGYGETMSYVNVNRDKKTLGGYWVEGRNPSGYSDKTVSLIKFTDENNDIIAVLMNYGCHATCGYLMRDFDGVRKTSGNFTGIASSFVEDHYGNGCVALWTSGAAGNVNPLLSHGMQYEYADGWTSAVDYPDGVGYMQMESIGREHGADCVKGIDEITCVDDKLPIKHIKKTVMIPAQKKAEDGATSSGAAFRMGGRGVRDYNQIPYGEHPPAPEGFTMVDDPMNPIELEMELVELGEIAIVCVNAEIYAEIGRDIKEASPFKNTFVITHTDIRGRAGYILDKSAAARGEKVFQAFGEAKPGGADDIIVKTSLQMFRELGKRNVYNTVQSEIQ